MSNDQPFPESLTVSVEPSFTSISHSNDIIFISKCHSVIFQIRSMLGVPSLTAQQYPIDLSSRQCIMITKFPDSSECRWLHYSFMETNFKSIGYVWLHWVSELLGGVWCSGWIAILRCELLSKRLSWLKMELSITSLEKMIVDIA